MRKILLFFIYWYQHNFSHDHSKHALGFCKFTPSCSEYAKLCFETLPLWKAFFLSFYRILRCNPFNKGGIDLPPKS